MPAPEPSLFAADRLAAFVSQVLQHFAIPPGDAQRAAEVLLAADLRGIDSHGVARLHSYFEMFTLGRINPAPNVRVLRSTPSTATVDADNGLGLVVAPRINEMCMDKAEAAGSGWISVCNTNHYGIAGWYAM